MLVRKKINNMWMWGRKSKWLIVLYSPPPPPLWGRNSNNSCLYVMFPSFVRKEFKYSLPICNLSPPLVRKKFKPYWGRKLNLKTIYLYPVSRRYQNSVQNTKLTAAIQRSSLCLRLIYNTNIAIREITVNKFTPLNTEYLSVPKAWCTERYIQT